MKKMLAMLACVLVMTTTLALPVMADSTVYSPTSTPVTTTPHGPSPKTGENNSLMIAIEAALGLGAVTVIAGRKAKKA